MWKVWRPIFGWDNLCPVYVSDPIGLILVMIRAHQPVSFEEIQVINSNEYDYYPDIDVEYKPENWGKIGEKLVCLDYGLEESEVVQQRRAYLEEKKGTFGVA